uniref:Uncharacterized mitochondrial protein AtMg00810-like n=1 Tax=Tanacetum cinerariifolium TaxID=118510 RepID=A0A699GZV3_TANCI|nr:uncharacterized mitochondrial protein AtMg00810-like [Tanacetum cinerariifolium]GEY78198.1 uncharacterized mitochondrial protein AtMg00810-like [Tanacetum cinerariifolium]
MYYKDDLCWSADLKSKAIEDIISIGSFMEVLVLNHYVLVRKIISGIVPNLIPQQPCTPPPKDEWDRLFQPMFDEYFTPQTIDVSLILVNVAPRAVDLADSPVSKSIDQDAPSTNKVMLIKLKCIYKIKIDEFGRVLKNKARLVAQRFKIAISQSPRGIFLNQSKYAYEIIKKYGLLTSDSVDIAMVEKNKLDKDLQGTPVDATLYHGMIGSLMYLTSSLLDLIYAVCLCAWYQAKPTEKHLNAVKQIF